MARLPELPCRGQGCNATVPSGGYCARCRRQLQGPARLSQADRTRLYDLVLWDRLRALVRAEEPLCRACLAAGRVTATTQVDHVKPVSEGGARFERANLQGLCTPCHSRKTANELHARGIWGSKT